MPVLDRYAETPVSFHLISGALALGIEPSAGCLESHFVLIVVCGNLQISQNPKKLQVRQILELLL